MVRVSECVCVCVCLHENRWFNSHTSRHDQYPSSGGLPKLPVSSGLWSPGISPAAGLCLKKRRSILKEKSFINLSVEECAACKYGLYKSNFNINNTHISRWIDLILQVCLGVRMYHL